MHQMIEFLAKHGYWVLFVAVLGRQCCVPVPADLIMLAAGALAGLGRLSLVSIVTVSITAFLLADLAWYEAGRRWGNRTLHFVCKVVRKPISYADQIEATFQRHGVKWLLISKFVIGLDAVAAPMSGISRISLAPFLVFDVIGAMLWVLSWAVVGYVFSDRLDYIANCVEHIGTLVVVAGVAGLCVHSLLKFGDFYRFLCEFRVALITPEDARPPED